MKQPAVVRKVLRINDVCAVLNISKSSVYNKGCISSKYYDPTFPKRFKTGLRSVGIDADALFAWIEARKCDSSAQGH